MISESNLPQPDNTHAHTHRAFITTTMELLLDGFPPPFNGGQSPPNDSRSTTIHLPRSPVQSVTSVQYVDTAGDTQTLAASKYRVDTKSLVPRITPAYGEVWPPTHPVTNAVTITLVAGYGDDPSDVPEPLKHAIKLGVATYYDPVRSDVLVGTSAQELPQASRYLLGPYRVSTHGGVGS